jgi:hypothetical protein
MPKRTPEEIMKSLDASIDDDIDDVLSMSEDERRKELEAAGYDLRELHAKADAWRGGAPAAPAEPPAKDPAIADAAAALERKARVLTLRPRRRAYWLLAAAAVTATVGIPAGIFIAHWLSPPPPPSPIQPLPAPSTTAPPPLEVADARAKGLEECDAGRWRACLDWLDLARTMDPAGDQTQPVQDARNRARAALEDASPPGPFRDKPPGRP